MQKVVRLTVLSAISTASVLMPLETTLADMSWANGEHISRKIDRQMQSVNKKIDDTMRNMWAGTPPHSSSIRSNDYSSHAARTKHHHHYNVDHRRTEQSHHHVERKTHRYVERHTTTHRNVYVNSGNSGDALAVGILGLATAAVLGTILKKPEQPQIIYQAPPQNQIIYQKGPQKQVVYKGQQPVQNPPLNQSSKAKWLKYCTKKYRSFNPQTGTFRGYDGLDHPCYAPVD
ncbi:BA14K family protein [Bartonella sp. 220]|uniref:BA14K family protein n=1 Tax=Bartonella sp. 220B TaxID=2967260 RepID=UPI0022A9AFB5|nr:BA14K family protein [Bartonella sp. 220B]MCZ2158364.1 BA14K family protein [Bartonella sp. 220B]